MSQEPRTSSKSDNIGALTSIRFLLILYIINGHFIQVASPSNFWLKFWKQHNMVVGCFFILSGYMLMFSYYYRALDHPGLRLRVFLSNRLQRIYPVYAVVLL